MLGSGLPSRVCRRGQPPGTMGKMGDRAHWCVMQSPSQQSQARGSCRLTPVTAVGVTAVTASNTPCCPLQWPQALQQTLGCRKPAGPSSSRESCLLPTPTDVPGEQHTAPHPPALCPRPGPPTPGASRHNAGPPTGVCGPVSGPSAMPVSLVDMCPGRCPHPATQLGGCRRRCRLSRSSESSEPRAAATVSSFWPPLHVPPLLTRNAAVPEALACVSLRTGW